MALAPRGACREIIVPVMQFACQIEDEFRKLWHRNGTLATLQHQPQDFPQMVEDQNFSV